MKKNILMFLALMLLISCTGHHNDKTAQKDTTYTYTDDYGTVATVPTHPTRIVSVSPGVTEIIFALGAQDLLVGRTDFCTYPAEVKKIESIGGISNLNIEKILSLKPDLVISGSMVPRQSVVKMNELGSPLVCVIEQQRFDSLYSNIKKVGRLVGVSQRADSLNQVLKARLAKVSNKVDTSLPYDKRPSVYYVVGFGKGGNFTAGGNTFINDIIRLAGGRNIAQDVTGWSYSLEALFKNNPDYIVIRSEDSAAFCTQAPYRRLRAVKNGHVITVKNGLLDLQTPRNVDAVEMLARALAK
ncbi:MAG: ABC transporter substrate-binding protein [Bacteroidales bacterium]|nr:ABC transporter substrate-binding protein [Bacteroidales bacterium]